MDVPLNANASQVVGTTALVTYPTPNNILRYLPGNLVQIGGANVYTLCTRPTLVSVDVYLFEFVENAGTHELRASDHYRTSDGATVSPVYVRA